MSAVRDELEANGEGFTPSRLLDVRDRTRAALWEIAGRMAPGVSEEEARCMASEVLRARGMRQGWHKVLVRFGPNTTLNFDEPPLPDVVLGDNDVFFIDIGPIYGGCEGDAGDTFAVGNDPDMVRVVTDVCDLWDQVRSDWALRSTTGAHLYQLAEERAQSMGWVLNLDLTGHRLSSFPHIAHYDGTLADIDFAPSDLLWVLEIQIKHPDRPFGAFFEDLLLYDDVLQSRSHRSGSGTIGSET
jgi:methionyl aminopeptidase